VTVIGEAGVVMVCDRVPVSFQLAKVYWQPAPQLTVGVAVIVWLELTVHVNACGVVIGVLSTVM
jgi:hypothetical protein